MQNGGRLLLNIPNSRSWSNESKLDSGHIWLPSVQDVKQLLSLAGFENDPIIYTRGFPFSKMYRTMTGRDLHLPFLGRSIQAVVEK